MIQLSENEKNELKALNEGLFQCDPKLSSDGFWYLTEDVLLGDIPQAQKDFLSGRPSVDFSEIEWPQPEADE